VSQPYDDDLATKPNDLLGAGYSFLLLRASPIRLLAFMLGVLEISAPAPRFVHLAMR
jgi:hypothetical protein